jgi:hypothetical protein
VPAAAAPGTVTVLKTHIIPAAAQATGLETETVAVTRMVAAPDPGIAAMAPASVAGADTGKGADTVPVTRLTTVAVTATAPGTASVAAAANDDVHIMTARKVPDNAM